MNKMIMMCNIMLLIILSLCLAGCESYTREIEDTTGYTPVRVCVEEISYNIIMKKGVLRIKVAYLNLSSEKCADTIDLGRKPKELLHKGDSLTMYLHPNRPGELYYVARDLLPDRGIIIKK